jgi:hypothetical protein
VQPRDFFVEGLGEDIDAHLVGVLVLPKIELSQHLVRERVRHDEAWVAGRATEVHEAAFRQHEDLVAIREGVLVHLWLDVRVLDVFALAQRADLNLVIEVADVADDRLVFHPLHVLEGDDVDVAGRAHVDVAATERVFDGGHFVAFHRRLKRVDWIDLGNDHARALTAQ